MANLGQRSDFRRDAFQVGLDAAPQRAVDALAAPLLDGPVGRIGLGLTRQPKRPDTVPAISSAGGSRTLGLPRSSTIGLGVSGARVQ